MRLLDEMIAARAMLDRIIEREQRHYRLDSEGAREAVAVRWRKYREQKAAAARGEGGPEK